MSETYKNGNLGLVITILNIDLTQKPTLYGKEPLVLFFYSS